MAVLRLNFYYFCRIMAGLYIHFPFCNSRCAYCDFFSTVNKELIPDYINTVRFEMVQRKEWLEEETVNTIYFGGGTPSLMKREYLLSLFDQIESSFTIDPNAEVTIEVNPDDINTEYAQVLSNLPFNRVSIGIQSMDDNLLKLIDRRHNSEQAINAIKLCSKAKFKNISVDLIYGLPGQTIEGFQEDINTVLALNVNHLSAYHLSYEKGTKLTRLKERGMITPIDENCSEKMYNILCRTMRQSGFIHYEISNFCQLGMESKHNSGYWQGANYLGLGAGAHSYNQRERCWNISDLDVYMKRVKKEIPAIKKEVLSGKNRINEMLMLSLRTLRGLDMGLFISRFGQEVGRAIMIKAERHIGTGSLIHDGESLRFTEKSLFISDNIISDLFF